MVAIFPAQNVDICLAYTYLVKCGVHYGVGVNVARNAAFMHVPKAALHAIIAGGVPTPAVTVPNTNPAAA